MNGLNPPIRQKGGLPACRDDELSKPTPPKAATLPKICLCQGNHVTAPEITQSHTVNPSRQRTVGGCGYSCLGLPSSSPQTQFGGQVVTARRTLAVRTSPFADRRGLSCSGANSQNPTPTALSVSLLARDCSSGWDQQQLRNKVTRGLRPDKPPTAPWPARTPSTRAEKTQNAPRKRKRWGSLENGLNLDELPTHPGTTRVCGSPPGLRGAAG